MTSKPVVAGAASADMNESARHYGLGLPSGLAAGTRLSSAFAESAEDALTRLTHRAGERRRLALLAHALETDVIPRLVLARHESAPAENILHTGPAGPTTEDVASLAHIVLRGDLAGAMAYVQDLRARNMPLERIYLSLLAPVARHLGELWTADRSDFASVTIGLCCLQQLVLENSAGFGPRPGRRSDVERRVLLAPVPGEQHSLGLLIVGEFFRRQGWDVSSATGASARELVAMARKERFSLMGFSLACESRLDILATLIRDVRRATRNLHLGILVGGAAFAERPELAALVGADATATDGQQAVLKAETLLALLARED